MHASADVSPDFEADLIRRTAQGDRSAFEQLFRAYEHRLYRYVLGIVREPQTAEEVTGDVMLQVWRNAAKFRGQSKASTWVFGIAHHKAVDALRKHAPPTVELGALHETPDQTFDPETHAFDAGFRRAVAEAMASLSPEHRAVLELTFNNGCSQAEIAAIVGCPVNTVKTRVFYAKRQLRQALTSRGIRREES